jgi:hypothetical protein
MTLVFQWVCKVKDHDWFPNIPASEFIPLTDTCLRCHTTRFKAPWGQCCCGEYWGVHANNRGQCPDGSGGWR